MSASESPMTLPDAGRGIKPGYYYDNAWAQARERLAALERLHDPGTIRHLESLGVAAGWHCLEVGGGGGSIAAWLSEYVGPSGRVLATDLDTRFLEALDFDNLEVRVHNIAEEELEEGAFDLVHARAVLMHIPQRQVALKRMVSALKPGGLLVVEEGDFISFEVDHRAGEHAASLWRKAAKMRSAPGGPDGFYGRRLYGDVLALGMVDVGAEGTVHMGRGATSHAEFWRLSFTQIRDRLLTVGEFSPEEVDQLIALFDNPDFVWMEGIGMMVWGRRPRD
jgi:SAM-dependent methyltransferase